MTYFSYFSTLLLLLKVKIVLLYFESGINFEKLNDNNNTANEETTKISKNLDMGICSCDLTNHCDFRCCCDNKDCQSNSIKYWRQNDICFNYEKDRIEDFKCKNSIDNFIYNKNKAGLSVKDHIHNIMCVQFDNSGDMGNFYDQNNGEDKSEEWKNNFFNDIQNNKSECRKYNNVSNGFIYKADSNGNCIRQKICCLIPYETSCFNRDSGELIINNFNCSNHIGNNIFINSNINNLLKHKLQWKREENGNKIYPFGYLRGNPIEIGFKDKGENNGDYKYYEKGFFIGMSDRNGRCARYLTEDLNLSPVLFKRNAIYSCILDHNLNETYFYNNFINKKLTIGKSLHSTTVDSIPLNEIDITENTKEDILIYLFIFTSKDGKENSPYDYIEHAELIFDKKSSNKSERPTISLIIKYAEFSYSSIINSKEGKITSLIHFSKEILDRLSEKK